MKPFCTHLLFFLLSLSLSFSVSAQTPDLTAVDDSICIMAGDSLLFNVTNNDIKAQGFFNPVFLIDQSACFGLTFEGDLYWLPGADAGACCGEHTLRYRYEMCQPPSKCGATIKIIVKCPKPDCFYVNLEDYFPHADPAGGNPGDPGCVFACENSGAVYFVNYDSASTYTWSVTGGTVTPGSNPAEIAVAWGPNGSGSISLTITNANGETTTLEFCVDILEGPVAAFQASADSICLNSPVSFVNNSVGGSTFFWDFGDGNTSSMFQPTHQYGGPGSYTVTLIVTKNNYDTKGNPLCCCSDTATAVVFIDPLPGPNIECISTLCAGDSSKYWTDALNCGTYLWTVLDENGNPWPFTGQGSDTICVQWGNGPTGTITLEVAGCDSAYCDQPVSVVVPIISPTVGINGLTTVCENATATYTVPKWMSVLYNWQVSGGTILSGQGTNVIVVQWGAAPGPGIINLNYASPFLGGLPGHEQEDCAGSAVLTVQIKPAFDVTGPIPPVVCVNSSSPFSATATPSANYTWTITPAVTFSGQGTANINVTWDAGPGTFTVTAMPNNPAAYCNQQVTKVIRVVETPKPTGISGPVEICPNGTDTYFGQSAQSGTGFQWTVVGGTPVFFIGNPLVVNWNAGGPYSVVLQQFSLSAPGCTSDTIRLNITPKLLVGPLSISGPNACINSVQNYTAAPAQHPAATYHWTVSPSALGSVVGGQGTPNAQVQWNNTSGPATLRLAVYLCGDSSVTTLPVTLAPAPAPVITQIGILCPGVPATLDAGAGYASYAWSTLATTQTISITTGGTYLVTTTNAGGCTAVGTYQAVPLPGPIASISTGNSTTLCYNPPNNTGTVAMSAITGVGYTFAWYRNGTLLVLPPTQSTYTHVNTQVAGTFNYWVVVTDANGCIKQSNTITIQQVFCSDIPPCFPFPHSLSFTAANPAPNCNTFNFTVTKSANVTVTGWNFGDPGNNVNSGTLPNATHTYTKAGCF
ncbi:MAG: PKD domain-containing protein [Lewinellaceae bacterium]|nr:PKD domain-containing protein [Lewinellaceae bacterium]